MITMEQTLCISYKTLQILTLERYAVNSEGLWPSRGAGQFTNETLQTTRNPTFLSAQR